MIRFAPRFRSRLPLATTAALFAASLLPASALAQDAPPDTGGGAPPPGQPVVVQVPPSQTTVNAPGYPPPGADLEGHLPSSSHGVTDASRSSDGFDLNKGSSGPSSVRGSQSGAYVVEGQHVPDYHTVRRGDTLWDISSRYYSNPYNWPRVWAYNSQIQNPHWIYPGDRVRLREGERQQGRYAFARRGGTVPGGTVFLRDIGWIDDPGDEGWGELVGAYDDQMLLADGDAVYIQLESKHDVQLGQELTIWQPLRITRNDGSSGELVSIRGTARVERYNPKTHTVKAQIVESLDTIERGAKVGPVTRKFDIAPPVPNDKDLEASIVAAIYPWQMYGQYHVVFIDRGENDGVKPGNRFFAIRRGDRWTEDLDKAGKLAKLRPRVEDQKSARVDDMELNGDEDLYPDETYAELRVVRVRKNTSVAVVTASTHEIEHDARLVAKKGY